MDVSADRLSGTLRKIIGQACWYIGVGGCTLPSFSIALGRRVKRQYPLRNPSATEEFRLYKGESTLLVWCTWRLDSKNSAIASSDDNEATIVTGLNRLKGKKLVGVEVIGPVWDAIFEFSDDLKLKIFCDHTSPEGSFDGNWEFATGDVQVYLGPGNKCEIEPRTICAPAEGGSGELSLPTPNRRADPD